MERAKLPLGAYWGLLAKHIRPQRRRFSLLAILLLSSIGLQIVNPQIVRAFIDAANSGETARNLMRAALAFVGIALLQQVIAVSASYVGENVAWTATNALRAELVRHCLNLDMSFHSSHRPGELIERIDGDVNELAQFFSRLVIRVLANLVLLVGILAALYLADWRAGAPFTGFALASLLVLNRVRGIGVPYRKAYRQAMADLFGYLEEQLAGTEDIRASGATDYVLRGLYRLSYAILSLDRKSQFMNVTIWLTSGFVLTLGNALAVLLGYHLHRSGAITVGTVYLIVQYINLLARPIQELARQVESMQTIGASVERLTELRQLQSKIGDGPGGLPSIGALSVCFDHVSFSYIDTEPVLEDVSFDLQPGRVLGLLGRTGSGKTTLARLIVRLYDPASGAIRLNGMDTRTARVRELRQCVAIVTQDVQLFRASVRDNLTFFGAAGCDPGDGHLGVTDERIREVIQELELEDWYDSLPDGLDTQVEAGGKGLSAGEAQLLAFTRVFLRDPGLVILDEASSRLDPVTEQRIERAVDKLLANRTAIVIAHRLHTVQRADEILILEGGGISEHGVRTALAADPSSRFYSLLQTGLEEMLA